MTEQSKNTSKGTENLDAVGLCQLGIDRSVLCHSDAMDHIDAAIQADEHYALPRLVKAWMLQGGRENTVSEEVIRLSESVEQRLTSGHDYEARLLTALSISREGNSIASATMLEQLLHEDPKNLYLHKLIQDEIFWLGKSDWMRDITEQAAPHWSETDAGFGSFLSFRAFANEEAGELQAAERFSRMAVEINSSDIWGTHALAHTLLMQGRMHEGIDELEALSSNWGHGNQMRHHLWWHICLFLFELGEHDRILALLDSEVRNPDSSLVKESPAAPIDIQNYASMLLRLELYGVDVSNQWQTLKQICSERVHNHGNAFGNVHDMMVLTATGEFDAAHELMNSVRHEYHSRSGSVAMAYNTVGIPVCEALIAHRQQDHQAVLDLLGNVRHDLSLIGGSHAQRDVFYHLLVTSAEKLNRHDLTRVYQRDIERIGFCDVPARAAYKRSMH